MKKIVFFIILLVALMQFKTFAATPVKIMPLGDSITYGVGDALHHTSGYRFDLYNSLKSVNSDIDFVGSVKSGDVVDKDNEGHPGWTIANIRSIVDARLATYQPDSVLLLIGTNNLKFSSSNVDLAVKDFTNLLDRIYVDRPNATVFVSSIPPMMQIVNNKRVLSPLTDSKVKPYNAALANIVTTRQSQGVKIYFVDNFSVLTPADFSDNLHPNSTGYSKMAAKWNEVVSSHLLQ